MAAVVVVAEGFETPLNFVMGSLTKKTARLAIKIGFMEIIDQKLTTVVCQSKVS